MGSARVEITRRKCQAFGNCIARAPSVFVLGADRKVDIIDTASASDDIILLAAKSCPYRVIAVIGEDGAQIFPPARK